MRGLPLAHGTLVFAGPGLPDAPELLPPMSTWRYDSFYGVYIGDRALEPRAPAVPHPDLYLRAAQLDRSDREAVASFLTSFGGPSVDPAWSGAFRREQLRSESPPLLGLPVVLPKLAEKVRAAHRPDLATFSFETAEA